MEVCLAAGALAMGAHGIPGVAGGVLGGVRELLVRVRLGAVEDAVQQALVGRGDGARVAAQVGHEGRELAQGVDGGRAQRAAVLLAVEVARVLDVVAQAVQRLDAAHARGRRHGGRRQRGAAGQRRLVVQIEVAARLATQDGRRLVRVRGREREADGLSGATGHWGAKGGVGV